MKRNKCSYCCYARCAISIVRVWVMPWPKTGATHYHAQLGLLDRGCAIKELVVCWTFDHIVMNIKAELHSVFRLSRLSSAKWQDFIDKKEGCGFYWYDMRVWWSNNVLLSKLNCLMNNLVENEFEIDRIILTCLTIGVCICSYYSTVHVC